jgi:hypothetical protein
MMIRGMPWEGLLETSPARVVIFAGTVMIVLDVFQTISGLGALFQKSSISSPSAS